MGTSAFIDDKYSRVIATLWCNAITRRRQTDGRWSLVTRRTWMTQPYGGINLHCCHQKLVAKIESTPAVSLLNPRVPMQQARTLW